MATVTPAALDLARHNFAALPAQIRMRRAEFGHTEPGGDEVRSAEIELALLAAGWPAELIGREPVGNWGGWDVDTLTLYRRSVSDSDRQRVLVHRAIWDVRSDTAHKIHEADARTGPTYLDIYGPEPFVDGWDDYLHADVLPTEAEAAILTAVFGPNTLRDLKHDVALAECSRWWSESQGGKNGSPEPNLDAMARSIATHRFTGWVYVEPVIPNRVWGTVSTYGPVGVVRYWPEGMPNLRGIKHAGGRSQYGRDWYHFTGDNAVRLYEVDPDLDPRMPFKPVDEPQRKGSPSMLIGPAGEWRQLAKHLENGKIKSGAKFLKDDKRRELAIKKIRDECRGRIDTAQVSIGTGSCYSGGSHDPARHWWDGTEARSLLGEAKHLGLSALRETPHIYYGDPGARAENLLDVDTLRPMKDLGETLAKNQDFIRACFIRVCFAFDPGVEDGSTGGGIDDYAGDEEILRELADAYRLAQDLEEIGKRIYQIASERGL